MPRAPRRSAPALDASASLLVAVTPARHLIVRFDAEAGESVDAEPATRIVAAFADGAGEGLLRLALDEVTTVLPATLGFWRDLATRYIAAVCARGDESARHAPLPPPDEDALSTLASSAPPMRGGEYVSATVLAERWRELDDAFGAAVRASGGSARELLQQHAGWQLVGRVHFNLAENRGDDDAPFAFLATYTTTLSKQAKPTHVPLGQALREYAGAKAKAELRTLLAPVQRAAESCAWLAEMMERGELFHPMRWTPAEALQLLRDVPALEAAGVVVRMPATWGARRPARPQATATVGTKPPGDGLGQAALLDFRASVSIDGEPLTEREIEELLAGTDGLRLLRGRWIELDRTQLGKTLDRLRGIAAAAAHGIPFGEAMRMLAGADVRGDDIAASAPAARAIAGPWLAETLARLRSPDGLAAVDPGPALKATLRPYQAVGVRWLDLLRQLGLGACLADDMGLGKTIQVVSLLLVARHARAGRPHLLVVPASLLGNWAAELDRFAPSLRPRIAHPSTMTSAELAAAAPPELADVDLVITTYGTLTRSPWLRAQRWDLAILDEAQAIKNPGTKQTRAVKAIEARARIALTGTPVENQLGDLWSIFDFLNPGLLGTAPEFTRYTKKLGATGYGPLRELIRPYVLRRLKTDRTIIGDLPDKTEMLAYCPLSPKQTALYQQAVDELAARLRSSDGIERRGVVLASLMRLKQICNSAAHALGAGEWSEADSGKLRRTREIAEVIAAKQEKLLVFTQFREATAPLAAFLAGVFRRPGLVLHGDTPVKERTTLVRRFQEDDAVPFFVLSLKAGGTGLNLTAASHVLHYDRWWNPAVEDQATDRAFRIGQKRNVLVHKLVCRGTVEERIEEMITSKRVVSQQLLEGTSEVRLTELDDAELMRIVALDLRTASLEATDS